MIAQLQDLHCSFLTLVRLGIGYNVQPVLHPISWKQIQTLAEQQGLLAVIVDGIECLPENLRPPKMDLLQWVGLAVQEESIYAVQWKTATEMAHLFHWNYIMTYVLKGVVVAECYPKPEHRVSADMDCYLIPEKKDFDAWNLGNELIKAQGYKVNTGFYKNSTFHLQDLIVENHQYMVPFRGNERLKELEIFLQSLLKDDSIKLKDSPEDNGRKIEGTWLYRPPVMVTALFLIEHAYSHFLHEGLTWRHVLDWMMFSRKHKKEIDWFSMDCMIDKYGFRKFYNSYSKLGHFLLGDVSEKDLTKTDKLMLDDIWRGLDLQDTVKGIKGKLALVGNTWRARWKYHYFADISMLHALWIQAKGVLFIKRP